MSVGKLLNIVIARDSFKVVNLTLIDEVYKNTKTNMKYSCEECGYVGVKTLEAVRSLQGCPNCYGNARQNLEHIQKYLASFGDTLLSKEYINSKELLECQCNEGHIYNINWNNISQSKKSRCNTCKTKKLSSSNSHYWKGGVKNLNLPLYVTYAPQLEKYQAIYKIEQDSLDLLGIECKYCGKVFVPTATAVKHFLFSANNYMSGESNLYCSDKCKLACPIHNQKDWPKDHKPYKNDRPDQKQWALMVKTRDNYTCQICGEKLVVGVAHHIEAVSQNPIESADVDNGITLCKKCHKDVHKLVGCKYNELKCK